MDTKRLKHLGIRAAAGTGVLGVLASAVNATGLDLATIEPLINDSIHLMMVLISWLPGIFATLLPVILTVIVYGMVFTIIGAFGALFVGIIGAVVYLIYHALSKPGHMGRK